MILADVNVLICAFRQDSPQHAICKPWLDGVVTGSSRFGVSPTALSSVVRMTTNPRIYKQPSSIAESFAFCGDLLAQPHCEIVRPGEQHWTIFKQLCASAGIRGPRVTDAWFAALAIEHGCTWITCDHDYARFAKLDWREPTV